MPSRSILINGSHPDYLIKLRGPLIRALIDKKWIVHVTSPSLDREARKILSEMGAIAHQVPLDRRGLGVVSDIKYLLSMTRLIRQLQPDLVFNYTIKPNIYGSIAAKLAGKRSIIMVTGLGYAFMPASSIADNVFRAAMRRLYRFSSSFNECVIFQNYDDRDDFVRAGSLADPTKSRFVNGSGVDMDFFVPSPLPDKPSFLMIARLLGSKGVREYAQAALRLIKEGLNANFRIAGFLDQGVDSIKQAEVDEWIEGGLEFLGKLDDVRPALRQTSVYVLPSYREGTPRTVLEAMASGRAIITSDAPGCRETVEEGHNGLIVPVNDVASLAKAMRQLALSPDQVQQMGVASLHKAQTHYDVKSVNAVMIGYFENALQ